MAPRSTSGCRGRLRTPQPEHYPAAARRRRHAEHLLVERDVVKDIEDLQAEAVAAVASVDDLDALDEIRVRFTGKRSDLAGIQATMRELSPDGRKDRGQQLNAFRASFQAAFDARREELASAALRQRLEAERLDLTTPPRRV